MKEKKLIVICSDALGKTAESVAKAALHQFDGLDVDMKRYSRVSSEAEIRQLAEEAAAGGGFIAYTLVQPELRQAMAEEAERLGIHAVDVIGPMMEAVVSAFHDEPRRKPGRVPRLDEEYFRRVEAIEFAVKCDDGKDPGSIVNAEIILIGVSRTSKTPLSVFLAHQGYKVANIPIVPEVKPPKELFMVPQHRIFGLTMEPEHMASIRAERLKAVGLPESAKYASLPRIEEELAYAGQLMNQLGCSVLNVTNQAIEESAAKIVTALQSSLFPS
ncbi:pyruvate, water dikinase regulatory protein [Paenibacillus turpanensis]|uniref:pyruvate, water dikinase regulatory protein n=1 Tax=Paenibacillus turpanensis TaxID=2689078 RepID=UPI0014087673|nr:pyruvate, water dikinase regulatory protein [Paenibacillus turpanensis]